MFQAETFTLAQTRTLKYNLPPNKMYLIDSIVVDANVGTPTETALVSSMLIDEVEQVLESSAATAAPLYFNQSSAIFEINATKTYPLCMLPARKTIQFTILNGVAAGSIVITVWALVHNDDDKKFLSTSTVNPITTA